MRQGMGSSPSERQNQLLWGEKGRGGEEVDKKTMYLGTVGLRQHTTDKGDGCRLKTAGGRGR
jgi:hypothetical protein